MSLIGLQTAVAAIIRCPRGYFEWDPDEFLKTFELTAPERRIVEKLSRHEELNKYGQDQASGRLEVVMNHLERVPNFVSLRVLQNIWFDLYEPSAIYNESDLKGQFVSSIAFLNFLREDKEARKRLKRSAPEFIFDLIAFEIAELELSRPLLKDPPLVEGSVVNNPHFRLLDIAFDIPSWLAKPEQEDWTEFEKPVSLVFVKSAAQFPKIFEITTEIKNFLLSQIGKGPQVALTEGMKADLVKMSLIR